MKKPLREKEKPVKNESSCFGVDDFGSVQLYFFHMSTKRWPSFISDSPCAFAQTFAAASLFSLASLASLLLLCQ
jgi:hypothetical protein